MYTTKYFLKFLKYDSQNGQFFWRDDIKCLFRGKLAGSLTYQGYRTICINHKKHLVHRLIWFFENGTWPEMIDHIDGNVANNKIENLRASRQRLNQQNRFIHREGKLVGANFHKGTQKWRAQIRINKKNFHLGVFDTPEEAHRCYIEKIKRLNL